MMDAVQKALRLAKADGGGSVQGAPDAVQTTGTPAFDATAFVNSLYQSELGRSPDALGMANWVNALQSGAMSQNDVLAGFRASSEYQNKNPILTANPSNYTDYITRLYQRELARAPEEAGLQGWVNALQSNALTPEQVRQQILNSSENKVQDIYSQEMNRQFLDKDAYNWVNALESGALTPDQVRSGVLKSGENIVQDMYQDLLNRHLDPGAQQFIDAYNSGALSTDQIKSNIVQSPEYKQLNLSSETGTGGTSGTGTGTGTGTGGTSGTGTGTGTGTGGTSGTGTGTGTGTGGTSGTGTGTGTGTGGTSGSGRDLSKITENLFKWPSPVDITKQGPQLVYKPEPYRDYGATAAAFRVASGLENLPPGFNTLSPTISGYGTSSAGSGVTVVPGIKPGNTYQDILNQLTGGQSGAGTGTGGQSATGGNNSKIADFYQKYLGRAPEEGAAQKWADAISSGQMTLAQVEAAISSSPEYNQNQITKAYKDYLKRAPEEGAAQNWASAISSGNMSLADVINSIKTSQEAQGLGVSKAPTGQQNIAPLVNSVASAYQSYLGRAPEPGAAEAWANAVASGQMTLQQALTSIAASAEAQAYTPSYGTTEYRKNGGSVKGYANGGGTDYNDLINAAYRDVLYRSPDEAGYNAWLEALTSGNIAPSNFLTRFKEAGYEDNIIQTYKDALGRLPAPSEIEQWNNALQKKDLNLDQFNTAVQDSREYRQRPYRDYQKWVYQNVPESDIFSEKQGNKMYDIDIGSVERMPRLEGTGTPIMNVKQAFENSEIERLKRELEAAKAAGTTQSRDTGGGGGNGGEGGSNFGGSDASGTAGGVNGSDYGGGSGTSPGSEGGSPATLARGGMAGNNAISNALRMIKADRR